MPLAHQRRQVDLRYWIKSAMGSVLMLWQIVTLRLLIGPVCLLDLCYLIGVIGLDTSVCVMI